MNETLKSLSSWSLYFSRSQAINIRKFMLESCKLYEENLEHGKGNVLIVLGWRTVSKWVIRVSLSEKIIFVQIIHVSFFFFTFIMKILSICSIQWTILYPSPSFYILRHYFKQGIRSVKGQSPMGIGKESLFSVHTTPLYKYINIKPFIYLILEFIEI